VLFDLSGNYWISAEDADVQRELLEFAERLALVLVEYVKGAA
jgi:hypothetical protein